MSSSEQEKRTQEPHEQHHPMRRYTDGSAVDRILESSTMKLTTIAALMVFLVIATYNLTIVFRDIQNSQKALREDMIELTQAVSLLADVRQELITVVNDVAELKVRNSDRWTRSSMKMWCRETQLVNGDTGWKCGNTEFIGNHGG